MSKERKLFEDNKVLLWGINKASKSLLDEFDTGNKNPQSISRKKDKEPKKNKSTKTPKVQEFDKTATYTIDDLDFLEKEYSRIEELSDKAYNDGNTTKADELIELLNDIDEVLTKLKAEEQEEIKVVETSSKDKWDKINKLNTEIDNLREEWIKSRGDPKIRDTIERKEKELSALYKVGTGLKKTNKRPYVQHRYEECYSSDDCDINININKIKGKGFKAGSEEAKKHAEKMRLSRGTILKKEKEVKTSKARVEKGSEEAKEISKRLLEARKAKQALKKKEEPKEEKKPLKNPWYYIGDIPKGYREATEDEAIENNKVSQYGKYQVDELRHRIYKDYNILLSESIDDTKLYFQLLGLKKRINKIMYELEVLHNKLENDKYISKKTEFENKLNQTEYNFDMMKKAYRWLYKLYTKRNNKQYVKPVFKLAQKEEVKPTKSTIKNIPIEKEVIIDPRTNKPITEDDKPKDYIEFENTEGTIKIPKKAFNDDKILKPKYAKQLMTKGYIFLPKYYTKEDQNKYFYSNSITGEGILSFEGLKSSLSGINWLKEKITSSYKGLIEGRDDYAPYVRDIIKKYGEVSISRVIISRHPIREAITKLLNYLSLGKFGKRMERKGYDELFHLRLLITLSNGKTLAIEKNEKIHIEIDTKNKEGTEFNEVVDIPDDLTLDKMLEGAKSIQGDNFHKYSAHSNNCQDFVMAILKGSNIGSSDDYSFVKQNTEQLFEKYDYLKNIADYTTDTIGRLNEIIYGAGVGKKYVYRKPDAEEMIIVQSIVFEKDEWSKANAIKWVKDNNYHYDDLDINKTQYRFRQFDPENLKDRTYKSEKIDFKDKTILFILSMKNISKPQGGKLKGLKIPKGFTKAIRAINPMTHAIENKRSRKAMIKAGEFTNDYALPAVVEAGKPLYYGTAGLASTALTGNPLLGTTAAKVLWEEMGAKHDPSKNQKSERLQSVSKFVGNKGSKVLLNNMKGEGNKTKKKRGRPKKIQHVEIVKIPSHKRFSHSKNSSLDQLLAATELKKEKERQKLNDSVNEKQKLFLQSMGFGVKKSSNNWISHVKEYPIIGQVFK